MEPLDEIIITYIVNEKMEEITIFGKGFVDANKDKCKIIFEEEQSSLITTFKLKDLNINGEEELEIKLIGLSEVTTMSYMFQDCKYLSSITIEDFDRDEIDLPKITDLDGMFYGCSNLKSLQDISKWDISNITSLHEMFYECINLKTLPDISKWNTSNVTDFSCMFYGCNSLLSLPLIGRWNTNKVNNLSNVLH